jgi:hypothetical protein
MMLTNGGNFEAAMLLSKDEAEHLLQEFGEKWGKKYSVGLDSW